MIVEVLQGRSGEVRQRLRLDGAPLTVGRGLSNVLVIDDPYVDAHHARLVVAEDGQMVLEDLGSVNRIGTTWEGRRERVVIASGMEVTVGRTVLRFRDEHALVAPALPLQRNAPAASAPEGNRWFERAWGRLAIAAGALAIGGLDSWLESTQRRAASETLGVMLSIAIGSALWAGIWSVAARAVIGQFRFLTHLAVLSVAIVAVFVLDAAKEWGEFFFPDNHAGTILYGAAMLGGLAALVAGHLAGASLLPRAHRWRVGAIVSGIVLALGGAFALLEDKEEFTAIATFSGVIKPVTPALVPTQSVAEFGATAEELRAEVDSLLAARGQ